ncbi:hypothetical protein DVS28_a0355 [Euzebya pacifica]|uniref:Uncharacterized protein n=1 Tax=Euzebya pacifica TaxID=1608957 RepID=A0A346XS65_9ACTN|nr:hypothetical protein DVS28_a0355 [Euzebya pacifica]
MCPCSVRPHPRLVGGDSSAPSSWGRRSPAEEADLAEVETRSLFHEGSRGEALAVVESRVGEHRRDQGPLRDLRRGRVPAVNTHIR